MAHIRKPLAVAVAVNTAIFTVEAFVGLRSNSISLLMDAVHNFSDELALVCLYLAYALTVRMSRGLQRSANLLNSVGLILVCIVMLFQAYERLLAPQVIIGWQPVAVGLLAAAGNWAVARVLRPWQIYNPAIRLAYLHNLGDVYVSLLPVLAGVLVVATGRPFFDPLLAAGVAVWIMWGTIKEIRQSGNELLWPEDAICPHPESQGIEAAH